MLNIEQLRKLVIRPALEHIELWSPSAENLVLGTALVESHCKFISQLGGGPARGLWQMEPATENDIHDNFLRYNDRLRANLEALEFEAPLSGLIGNLYYGAAMCRIHYRRAPEALPAEEDSLGMARLWKKRYNTAKGAGEIGRALPYFQDACKIEEAVP